jgi:hypothetical protein
MLSLIRERLTLILLILLPFHAFLVTVLTKVFAGPNHAPITVLSLWKEGLLGLILIVAIAEIVTSKSRFWRIDWIDGMIVGLVVLSVLVSLTTGQSVNTYLLGFRYDFVPLIAFLILRRVEWSEWFLQKAAVALLIDGVAIATYGIATLFLPQSFFTWLGYSDKHSLYIPSGPVAAFQYIGESGIRRVQSTFSGPNQFGLWLLLPWSVVLSYLISSARKQWIVVAGLVIGAGILVSFSRSAWISAVVIALVFAYRNFSTRNFYRSLLYGGVIAVLCGSVLLTLNPSVLSRATSSGDHLRLPLEAVQKMIQHPFGLGIGTAGPASNRTSDTCVKLQEGADASWAKDAPGLCVFVGGTQVQPVGRACHCPLLTENWYLQMGVELGVIGFVLFCVLTVMVGWKLAKRFGDHPRVGTPAPQEIILFGFIGISVAALFLHAWEDAAVAYTVWILVATRLSLRGNR